MAYCKWCGMDSRNDRKCEWCGKDLAPAATAASAQTASPQTAPPPVQDYVVDFEDDNRKQRITFYVSCSILTVLACGLIALRYSLYPAVSQSSLLIAGILLGALRILPPIEDEWQEFIIPAILILVCGPVVAFLGYLIYGLVTKQMDLTVVWLLSVYLVVLTAIQVTFLLTGPDKISMKMAIMFRPMEVTGLVAIVVGWAVSGIFRPMNR